jgi:glycerophosphoryl diester phosphodiesterase
MNYQLSDVATYAHGIGPSLRLMYEHNLLKKARENRLLIHPWFLRDEQLEITGNPITENALYVHQNKLDGLFTEWPHLTLEAFEYALTHEKETK